MDFLWPVYAAVNQARGFSAALRSSNRYFINQTVSGNPQPSIFSVAKYEQANGSPNLTDVVFAFADLDRYNQQQGNFNVNITQNGANLFGIKPGRTYNVRNIAAYTAYDGNRRNYWLWGSGLAGSNVLANGVFVALNPVPASDSAWTNAPFEGQYLKLYDVTPPAAPAAPSSPKPYALGACATFSWPALVDLDGGISAYHILVGTSPGGSNIVNLTVAGTTVTATNTYGQTLYARVSAINNAGVEGPFSPNSTGTILLDPSGDYDHDGMSNAAEDVAGTNPLDANSVLRILELNDGNRLTWSSVSGKTYRVCATADLTTNFAPISGIGTGTGPRATYLDSPATNSAKFYRINVLP